ncbi:hypothetical protein Tco_0552998 [Tanacetum coccineum]
MTMRPNPMVDTLSIDDLYNNLRVFEQELTSTTKSYASAQNVAFVSHSKSSTNKVKSGHTGAYSTYTPSTFNQRNIPEREVTANIEEMDINWQIAMIAIRMKKFYKKTRRRVRIDGNKPVGFDKKKLECSKCHNTGKFIYMKKMKEHKKNSRIRINICKRKAQLQKTVDSWKDSSKNLWKLVDSGMSSTSKVGLGYEIKSNDEVLSYEEEMNRTVFNCTAEDFIDKPLYSRFSKTDSFKGVPHPLTGDYTPKPQ